MFWNFITPIVVTIVVTPLLYLAVRRSALSRRAGIIAVVAIIPTCGVVKLSSDAYRFREHHFANVDSITFSMVRPNIPPQAKNIELYFKSSGYWAKFDIEKSEIESWFHMRWEQYGSGASYPKEASNVLTINPATPHQFNQFFSRYGWSYSGSVATYIGPISSNGSGSHLYFNPDAKKAYQFYGFW